MALTVTNLNTLQLLNIVNQTSAKQTSVLERLATGKRINRGADDPAGLIAAQLLSADLVDVNAAITNNQRTDSQLAVADSALLEVSTLLQEIEALVAASTNSGGLSAAEISANQSQIDSAISSIDRIVRTTTFNGSRLLDGSLGISSSGVDNAKVENLRIFSRPQATSAIPITAQITGSAQTASASFGNFDSAGTGVTTSGVTVIAITGTIGTATVTIGSGLNRGEIISAINTATAQTGVSASVDGNNLSLNTTGFGSDEFIAVDLLSGGILSDEAGAVATNTVIETTRVEGSDPTVTINGQLAQVEGLDVFFTAGGVSLQYSLESSYGTGAISARSNTETFNIELTGGATFQLGTDTTTRETIGISNLFSFNLGGGDAGAFLSDLRGGETASLANDTATALQTIKKAVQDVATERGRIGAFQKFQVQSSIRSLEANKLGLEAARSIIEDTDFAKETAELNRQTVLLQSGIQLLGLANQQSGQILQLF